MKRERTKILAVITGGILFNLVFWQEKMALNAVLYDAFLLVVLFYLYPEARRNPTVRWLTFGHLICLGMIIINNTLLSKIAFGVTLGLMVGFIEYVHRSVWYAGGSSLVSAIFVPASVFEAIQVQQTMQSKKKNYGKAFRFAIIPLLLLLIFFFIYSSANSVFSDLTGKFGNWVSNTFGHLFDFFSWGRFLFLLLGVYLTGWILLKSNLHLFESREKNCTDNLTRKKIQPSKAKPDLLTAISTTIMGRFGKGMIALKNSNTVGLISLALLNLLLLVVNIIDITYIWFGFKFDKDVNLYKMIHQGTDTLIISILLAMSILIIFFRGNLNFYQKNKWLKYGAYAWIIQNSILVISVFLRDYYYIIQTGLAYKRIGVLFYLALVMTGLITVFWKIYAKKTTYYLFRVNAWAVIILLVASTAVNWDELIASYNFSRKDKILMPVDYMLTLSNKAIPLLHQNAEVLKEQWKKQEQLGFVKDPCYSCIDEELKWKKDYFKKEYARLSWLSFNLADESINEYFHQESRLSSK